MASKTYSYPFGMQPLTPSLFVVYFSNPTNGCTDEDIVGEYVEELGDAIARLGAELLNNTDEDGDNDVATDAFS
jgi:hypothetical protein